MAFKTVTTGVDGPTAGVLPETIALDDVVHYASGTTFALNPLLGRIQVWTMTGDTTITDSMTEGQTLYVFLRTTDPYHHISYPQQAWMDEEPYFASSHDVVILKYMKVDGVLYYFRVAMGPVGPLT